MPKAVIVDYEKCTGCRICEICVLQKMRVQFPTREKLRELKLDFVKG